MMPFDFGICAPRHSSGACMQKIVAEQKLHLGQVSGVREGSEHHSILRLTV